MLLHLPMATTVYVKLNTLPVTFSEEWVVVEKSVFCSGDNDGLSCKPAKYKIESNRHHNTVTVHTYNIQVT